MTIPTRLIPLIAISGLMIVSTAAQAQEQVGVNAAVRNSVQTRSGSAGAFRPAVVRAPVKLGDQFVTGANSQVQVLLKDRSTFTVGANARMTVDRFVAGNPGSPGGVTATVAKGAFRFASGKTTRGASRQAITTPVASIGVRGTIVEGIVGPEALELLRQQQGVPDYTGDPENMLVVVLRGPSGQAETFDTPGAVDVEGGGSSYTLDRPGQTLIVTSDGVFGPFELPDGVSAQLIALLIPSPTAADNSAPGEGIDPVSIAADDTGDFTERLPPPDATGGTFEPTPDTGPGTNDPGGEDPFPLFPPVNPNP
jgi:hypothetical protein